MYLPYVVVESVLVFQHSTCTYLQDSPPPVELPDRPPDYETVVLPNGNRQETCISIDDDDAPPLLPLCKPDDIIGCRRVQHGTDALYSMPTVEELQVCMLLCVLNLY